MQLVGHDVSGSGRPLLLLHAGVADRRMWEPQLAALARNHRVLRVDLRGFGESPLPDEPYDHVADLVAVLDAVGMGRVRVVGASFGGLVAQELAVRHPDRVGQLVLLCPASALLEPDDELRTSWTLEAELLEAGDLDGATALNTDTWCGPEAGPDARELVRQMQRRAFELQTERTDLEIEREPGDPRLVDVPALVVSGDHDLAAFRRSAGALAAALPRGTLHRLPWAGHLPSLERPEETTALLLDALG